jgi:hypothetical protein
LATNNDANEKPKSNRLVVLQAIVDLCAANRQASRRAISDYTDLPMVIVDDHVKNLKDDELIRTVVPGIFEPVDQTADRAVSGTFLPNNGRYKLEIGDLVLDLTMREARAAAVLLGGVLLLGR